MAFDGHNVVFNINTNSWKQCSECNDEQVVQLPINFIKNMSRTGYATEFNIYRRA